MYKNIFILLFLFTIAFPGFALSPKTADLNTIVKNDVLDLNSSNPLINEIHSNLTESLKTNNADKIKQTLISTFSHLIDLNQQENIPFLFYNIFNSLNESQREMLNICFFEIFTDKKIPEILSEELSGKTKENESSPESSDASKKITIINLNAAVDISVDLRKNPLVDKNACLIEPGGRGANCANALNIFGNNVKLYSPVFGTIGALWQVLANKAEIPLITENHFQKSSKNTRMNIHDTSDGKELRFDLKGPELTQEEIEYIFNKISSLIENDSVVVLSGTMPPGIPADFLQKIIIKTNNTDKKNVNFCIDSKGKFLRFASETNPFLIKTNLKEFSDLSDIPANQLENNYDLIIKTARKLISQGKAQNIIVSLGEEGAFLINKNNIYKATPSKQLIAKSPVGSGDSLLAGFIDSFIKTGDCANSLKQGVAYGTATALIEGSGIAEKKSVSQILPQIALVDISPIDDSKDTFPEQSASLSTEHKKWLLKYLTALKQNSQGIWITDMDETLTSNPNEKISPNMAKSIISYLQGGGLMMLITGSKIGDTSSWLKETTDNTGIIKLFLEPLYQEMVFQKINLHEINKLFSQVLLAPNTGNILSFVDTINNDRITLTDLYRTLDFNQEIEKGFIPDSVITEQINRILGIADGKEHFLASVYELNSSLPLEFKISWELDLLHTMILAGDLKNDWGNLDLREWFPLIRTFLTSDDAIRAIYSNSPYLEAILNAPIIETFIELELKITILKEKLIKKWQSQYGDSPIVDKQNQLSLVLLGINKPPKHLKTAYQTMCNNIPENLNLRKQFVNIFRKEFDKYMQINFPHLRNISLLAKSVGSTSIDFTFEDKGSAIQNLKQLQKYISSNEKASSLSGNFIPENVNIWIRKLKITNLLKKWSKNLFVIFSGDSINTPDSNDFSAIAQSDVVLNASKSFLFPGDFIDSNKDKIFIQPDTFIHGDNFILLQLIGYLNYFHSDYFINLISGFKSEQLDIAA